MFSEIFQTLGDVARSPIQFVYIHKGEKGVRTVTLDMCNKQAPGITSICKTHVKYMSNGYRLR